MNDKTQTEMTFSGDWIYKRTVFDRIFNISMKRVWHVVWALLLCIGLLTSLYGWYKFSQTYKIKIERVEVDGTPY